MTHQSVWINSLYFPNDCNWGLYKDNKYRYIHIYYIYIYYIYIYKTNEVKDRRIDG